ncbi:uncharacterized protein BO87DRAFT_392102 [Aspergillus neoniger CBS 115656]|uniref:Uncharacterized protein n=1 Tax=Aspergillus neoniger (strain CBS 115656) TaxID=1448310 RepID=A0A318YIQ5_ASPNB|nr:hypothetical protein BO87DRAFT_392102 [Aspergillus neoniger CBS 115656]PYH28208.1 hypothetical protein BO87DRAFT_392102 [Aspergillus neoniger CBS 115656]
MNVEEQPSILPEKVTEKTADEILKGGKKVVLQLLHFSDQDWIDWLTSDLIRPYWIDLWTDCLLNKNQTKQGVGLAVVQEAIIKGESHGEKQYNKRKAQNKPKTRAAKRRQQEEADEPEADEPEETSPSPSRSPSTSPRRAEQKPWMEEALSKTKKIVLSHESSTFNIAEPFWRFIKITAALMRSKPKSVQEAEDMVILADSAGTGTTKTSTTETGTAETDHSKGKSSRRKRAKKKKPKADLSKLLENNIFNSNFYETAENLE